MRKSIFVLGDDHNAYIGYTNDDLWNGWATPYFTLEEAQRLQANINAEGESPMLYDVAKDEFRIQYEDDDEPYIWKGEDIKTRDGDQHLYGIGAYSHIWDELDKGFRRELAQRINDFLYDYDTYSYEDEYDDADEVIEDIITQLANLNTFAKAYEVMYNDAYSSNEIYTQLSELLNI